MLIALTNNEKSLTQENREYLIELSQLIRNNDSNYSTRALNREKFVFNK